MTKKKLMINGTEYTEKVLSRELAKLDIMRTSIQTWQNLPHNSMDALKVKGVAAVTTLTTIVGILNEGR